MINMYEILKNLSFLSQKIFDVLKIILILLMGLMILMVTIQVFFRYIIFYPLPWTNEVSRYAMIIGTMIGGSCVTAQDGHISITILLSKVPKLLKIIFKCFIRLIEISYILILGYAGWHYAFDAGFKRFSTTLYYPLFYIYVFIPIGALLFLFFSFLKIPLGDNVINK